MTRYASAIQIVRPLESIAETQPQLQPALLRLSAMISQYFTRFARYLRWMRKRCFLMEILLEQHPIV